MLAKKRAYRRLWNAVKKVIRENYELIAKRSVAGVRGSRGIRASYYIVGDLIAPLIGKTITMEDYNWFLMNQGYASYRDDIWTQLEQKDGLVRPEAKPIGIVYDDGIEYTIKHLEKVYDQARGFIFVEKADEASALQELSEYGWTIVAGQGYPTRLIRKLLKEDKRPVLALHDWDRDGEGVYRALGFTTRRTAHLDFALGERVTDLGLHEEHAKALNLPTRPSPPKYKGRPRVELSALEVLSLRMKIENPILAYVCAVMVNKGIKLSETEIPKIDLMKRHIRWALTDGLSGVVEEAVKIIIKQIQNDEKFQGTAVKGEAEDLEIIEPGLVEKLVLSGFNLTEKTNWISEDEKHEEAMAKFTTKKLIRRLK